MLVHNKSSDLPHSSRLNTSQLLDFILDISNKSDSESRKKLYNWLYVRTRLGAYYEINNNFHISYFGQPNGTGTFHYWNVYYTDIYRTKILKISFDSSSLKLRSKPEHLIARELYSRQILFFTNCAGIISPINYPLLNQNFPGRLEVDFIIFLKGKVIALEIDGKHHNQKFNRQLDYCKDRVLTSNGFKVYRYSSAEVMESPNLVVDELIKLNL